MKPQERDSDFARVTRPHPPAESVKAARTACAGRVGREGPWEPGATEEVAFELSGIGHAFPPGNRIRVNFPAAPDEPPPEGPWVRDVAQGEWRPEADPPSARIRSDRSIRPHRPESAWGIPRTAS
jgi:predicted acyl esterase